jgi:hypothetical protein
MMPGRHSEPGRRTEAVPAAEVGPTPPVGAKLGAMLSGLLRTAMDAGGLGSASLQALRTPMDTYGHGLDIYGSGGWVFESPRARW